MISPHQGHTRLLAEEVDDSVDARPAVAQIAGDDDLRHGQIPHQAAGAVHRVQVVLMRRE